MTMKQFIGKPSRVWMRASYMFIPVICTALPVLSAAAAPAEGGGGGGGGGSGLARPETSIPAAIAAIIVFIILYYILQAKAWPMIVKGLEDRANRIRTEIEAAESSRAQADAALENYHKELAKARAEANTMIQQARADAQKVADELRARNEDDLTAMKNKAKQEIEAAKRAALAEIYAETATLATSIAGRILQREINSSDNARLVRESLDQLGSLNGAGNARRN